MAQFTDLLGSLMQAGMSRSSNTRATNALGGRTGAGSLTDIVGGLGKMLGGSRGGSTQGGSATVPGNLGGMLGSVLESFGSNKAAVGGLGALAGALLGGGSKATKGAVGGGTLAMLASLAFSALQNAGQKPPPPQALIEPETPQQQEALENDALIIVKAMINAAKADGAIDQNEVQRIIGKLDDNGLTEEEKQFFLSESKAPADTQGLINAIGNRPDLAAQVYAASLLAIEIDTPAERRYLETLAAGLQLPAESVSFIEKTLGMT